MPETFGARLRRCREEQNIALGTIAAETKIQLSLLEALERDDVSHWPSGIFRRAYIRAYAQAIGLSPDLAVREFVESHPDPDEVIARAAAMLAAETGDSGGGAPLRIRNIMDSAIGSLSRFRRSPPANSAGVDLSPVNEPSLSPADDSGVAPRPNKPTDERGVAARADIPSNAVATSGFDVRDAPEPSHARGEGDPPISPVVSSEPGDPAPLEPDLAAFAQLCTELGRVESADTLQPLLNEAARLLGATGLILWMWDAAAGELRAALAHGYSDSVLAQLPGVRSDDENATAAAFRLCETYVIAGDDRGTGAFVAPLLTPDGCAGVLALELRDGAEHRSSVRALATILAAFLAHLLGCRESSQVSPHGDSPDPDVIVRPRAG